MSLRCVSVILTFQNLKHIEKAIYAVGKDLAPQIMHDEEGVMIVHVPKFVKHIYFLPNIQTNWRNAQDTAAEMHKGM